MVLTIYVDYDDTFTWKELAVVNSDTAPRIGDRVAVPVGDEIKHFVVVDSEWCVTKDGDGSYFTVNAFVTPTDVGEEMDVL